MPHRIVELFGGFPFVLMIKEQGRLKINWPRIVEALIIAAVAGVIAGYIAVQRLTVQVDAIENHVDKLDTRIWEHIEQTNAMQLPKNNGLHPAP